MLCCAKLKCIDFSMEMLNFAYHFTQWACHICACMDSGHLCFETCYAQRCYVQSYFQFLAFISFLSLVNSYADAVIRWSGILQL